MKLVAVVIGAFALEGCATPPNRSLERAREVEAQVRQLPPAGQRHLVGEWDVQDEHLQHQHCVEAIVRGPNEYISMQDCAPIKPSCCEGEGLLLTQISANTFRQEALKATYEIQSDGSLVLAREGFPTKHLLPTEKAQSLAATWK